MKRLLLILTVLYSFSTFGQSEIILRDKSNEQVLNPFQSQLDNLYLNDNDSIEIFYIPELKLPDLYFINEFRDTVFIKVEKEKKYRNFLYFKQFVMYKDSTLLTNIDQLYFQISVNWNGEIYLIKACKKIGDFDTERWIVIWNEIKAIPGTNSKIPDKFSFIFPVISKNE